jgi:hypothetical protein
MSGLVLRSLGLLRSSNDVDYGFIDPALEREPRACRGRVLGNYRSKAPGVTASRWSNVFADPLSRFRWRRRQVDADSMEGGTRGGVILQGQCHNIQNMCPAWVEVAGHGHHAHE